jgi:hypothetical protein
LTLLQIKRKDEREGRVKPPWNHRPRRKPKPITAIDLMNMEKRTEEETKRKRRDKMRAMVDAKNKRAVEAQKLKKRSKVGRVMSLL